VSLSLTDFQYKIETAWCREQGPILVGRGDSGELYSNVAVFLFNTHATVLNLP
jgi:hypothetical protein